MSVHEARELLLRIASTPELAERLKEPGTHADAKRQLLREHGFAQPDCNELEEAAAGLDPGRAAGLSETAKAQGVDVATLLKRAHDIANGFCTLS